MSQSGRTEQDFPIVCETCLGPNPYVRMQKAPMSKECKVCSRPMTVFRWKPGSDARYKQTVACQVCAKLKNVCQVCLFDLQYGLPVGARDSILGTAASTSNSFVNQQYIAEQQQKALEEGTTESTGVVATNEDLLRAARTAPYYKRNAAKICSFFVKGKCTRGDSCPFRHELPPADEELAKQNIKDRYNGENDPLAKRVLSRIGARQESFKPPSDTSIATLYVGGVDGKMVDANDLTDLFYSHGEIKSIRVSKASKCAFVTFKSREDAEKAAKATVRMCLNGK